jgi:hypothetical protein
VGCVDPGSLGIENRVTIRKLFGTGGEGAKHRGAGDGRVTGPAMPLQARKECRGEKGFRPTDVKGL